MELTNEKAKKRVEDMRNNGKFTKNEGLQKFIEGFANRLNLQKGQRVRTSSFKDFITDLDRLNVS